MVLKTIRFTESEWCLVKKEISNIQKFVASDIKDSKALKLITLKNLKDNN